MSKTVPPISKHMTTVPEVIQSSLTIAEAKKVMDKMQIRHLPVMEGNKLYGILTDRDIKLALSLRGVNPEEMLAYDVCINEPYTVSPEAGLDEVAQEMADKHYGCVVVLQNEEVVGIFTTVDACRALSEIIKTRYHK